MTAISNEAYVVGSLLIDDNVIPAIRGIVSCDDFHVEVYRAIFSAALSLEAEGEVVDPPSIGNRAKREGTMISLEFMKELMECIPTAANCVEYAYRVAEEARTRRIKELAIRIQEDEVSSSEELLATLHRESEAIRGSSYKKGLLTPSESLRKLNDYIVNAESGHRNFIPSGYAEIDRILGGGFIRGGLYIIGARPAMGKSTFAINLADNIKGNCLFVSLEMTPEQITSKRVSRLTGLSSTKILSGKVSEEDWTKVALAYAALSEQGLFLNDQYDLTVQKIQLLAQRVPDLKAVFIDYLGLIQPATRSASSYENISAISRELKRMAISLNVPVICLCQLSRSVENRTDKSPKLSDLRDSGSIEQDADAVMLLYRQDYYNGVPEGDGPSLTILNVAKNRHGRTGETAYNFFLQTSAFMEISRHDNR